MVATVATVAVVGVAAAVFEVALLPGIVLGVAAVAAPRYFPKMGAALNPLFRSTVRGAYKLGQKTREMMAEAQEQVHDIVAEVHAEGDVSRSRCGIEKPGRRNGIRLQAQVRARLLSTGHGATCPVLHVWRDPRRTGATFSAPPDQFMTSSERHR